MKLTLTESDFVNRFLEIRPENFSREALRALFDYYECLSVDTEFDPIAICCDWTEYDTALEAAKAYSYNGEDDEERALDWLFDQTSVLQLSEGCVVLNF